MNDEPAASEDTDLQTTATVSADTDAGGGTYVPPLMLCVFGLPIFLVLVWFFMRFTAPDRFGRVDRSVLDALEDEEEGPEGTEDGDDPPDDPKDPAA